MVYIFDFRFSLADEFVVEPNGKIEVLKIDRKTGNMVIERKFIHFLCFLKHLMILIF